MAIGVPRPLAIEKPQAVDLVQAARYFGAHGEPDAATLALLQKCAVPLLAAAAAGRSSWVVKRGRRIGAHDSPPDVRRACRQTREGRESVVCNASNRGG